MAAAWAADCAAAASVDGARAAFEANLDGAAVA